MKQYKNIFILSILLIILSFNVLGLTQVNGFTKIYSNSTNYLIPSDNTFNYDSDTIYYGSYNYDINTLQKTLVNSNGSYSYLKNDYLIGFGTSSDLLYMYKSNRSVISSISEVSGSFYNFNFIDMRGIAKTFNSKYITFFVTIGFQEYAILYEINTSNQLQKSCEVEISTYGYGRFLGNDNDYFYVENTNPSYQYKYISAYNYNCNLIYEYSNSTMKNLDLTYSYNFYDNDEHLFVAVDNTNKLKTYIFNTDGSLSDSWDLSLVLHDNYINNFTLNTNNSCTYDSTLNKLYCLGYHGLNQNNLSLVSIPIKNGVFEKDVYGVPKIINYNIYDYFNNINDTYTMTSSMVYLINSDLYVKLKDTTDNTYDVFKINQDIINEYYGLICNTDKSKCYEEVSTCIKNDNYVYVGVNTSNLLCTKGVYTNSQNPYEIVCSINGSLINCNRGCDYTNLTNPYGINYYRGVCHTDGSCTNQCLIPSQRYSDSPNSYKVCSDTNNDGCLEWSNPIFCSITETSINGICKATNTTSVYNTLNNFVVLPLNYTFIDYTKNPVLASYKSDKIAINTQYQTISSVNDSNNYTFFILRNCEYNNTLLVNDINKKTVNTSNISFNGFSEGYYNVEFENNELTNILGLDVIGRKIFDYNVTSTLNNVTNEQDICLRGTTSTLCMSESLSNIKSINIQVLLTTYQTTYTSVRMIINKNVGESETIYGNFKIKINPNSDNLYTVLVTSNNLTINTQSVDNTRIYSNPSIKGWYQTNNLQNVGNCYYTSIGCRTVRTYYTDNEDGSLWNYKDLRICIDKLGDVINTNSETTKSNDLFGNWNDKTKFVFSFITALVLTLVIFGFGITQNDEGTKKIIMFVGGFVFVGTLIIFSIIGWVPIWFLIISGIISSLIVGLIFVKSIQGSN